LRRSGTYLTRLSGCIPDQGEHSFPETKSILCDEETYLLALLRYIHLNPVRAKVVKTMKELDGYPWSGHRMIIAKDEHPWMGRGHVLDQFADTKGEAIRGNRRFVQEGLGEGRNPMLTGGGLIRSHGGWSLGLILFKMGNKKKTGNQANFLTPRDLETI